MNKAELSSPKQSLIKQCQQLNFGRITFHVRGSEPDPTRPWHTRRTVKLGSGENGPRSEAGLTDFELCKVQQALLETLGQLEDGTQVTVEVRHGLPFLIEIEQDHRAA